MDMLGIHPRLGDVNQHYRSMRAAMGQMTRDELELVLYGNCTDGLLNRPTREKEMVPFPSLATCDAALAANLKMAELMAKAEQAQLQRN